MTDGAAGLDDIDADLTEPLKDTRADLRAFVAALAAKVGQTIETVGNAEGPHRHGLSLT